MSSKHRRTLEAVFANPVRANILWSDVESMLRHYGARIRERAGSRAAVYLNGNVIMFHRPHPRKEGEEIHDPQSSRFPEQVRSTPMKYRGYTARFAWDEEEKVFLGQIDDIEDVVTFEADTPDEIEREFRISVDEYLAFCAEEGIEPERPGHPRIRAAS
jgi:predicted RNase H-like HicB family nuclease